MSDFRAAEEALNIELAESAYSALTKRLTADARVHRFGSAPFVGASASAAAIKLGASAMNATRLGDAVSAGGDLAYSYGKLNWIDARGQSRKAFYLRIWRRSGGWKLVLDQINPIGETNQ